MIKLNNISKKFKKTEALKNVSMEIKRNSIVGFIGPNGSGKSTLIKIITGLINQFEGSISYNTIEQTDIRLISEKLRIPLYYSLGNAIKVFAIQGRVLREEVVTLTNKLGLEPHIKKSIKQLSQGLGQRLNILCSLFGSYEIIIFDEPNNGLDPEGFILLRELIFELKKKGKTIVIASHLLYELEQTCDEIIMLKSGQLIGYETKSDLVGQYGSIENAYMKFSEKLTNNVTVS